MCVVFKARYEATEQQARRQVAAAARSVGDKATSGTQPAGAAAAAAAAVTATAAAEEERGTAAALEEVHRPLLAVRGMARVWGLTKLSTWLEGGGKEDLMGRTRMVAVMRELDQLAHADGAWGEEQHNTSAAAQWVPTEDNPNPPDAPFWKLSTCEGPSRQRLRTVRDGCGTRHLSAARPVVNREDEYDAAMMEQAEHEPGSHRMEEEADGDAMGTGMFSAPAPARRETCRVSFTVFRSDVVKVELKVEVEEAVSDDVDESHKAEDTWHGGMLGSALSIGSILEVAAAADSPHRSLFSTPTQLPTADYTDGGLMTHRGEAPSRGNDGVPTPAGVVPGDVARRRRRRGGESRSYRGDHVMQPKEEVTQEEEEEEEERLRGSVHRAVEGGGMTTPREEDECAAGLLQRVDLSDQLSAQLQQSGVVRGDLPLMGAVEEEEEEEAAAVQSGEGEEEEEEAGSRGGEEVAAGGGAAAEDGNRGVALEEASRTEEGIASSVAGGVQTPRTPQRGSRTAGSSGSSGGTGSVREKLAGLVAGMTPTAQRVVSSARVTAAQVVRDVGAAVQDRALEGVEMARDVVGAARAAMPQVKEETQTLTVPSR